MLYAIVAFIAIYGIVTGIAQHIEDQRDARDFTRRSRNTDRRANDYWRD